MCVHCGGTRRPTRLAGAPAVAGGSRPRRTRDRLRYFRRVIEDAFALSGPYPQRVFVEDFLIGFKEINHQSGSKQFKGADHVGPVRAIGSLFERLRAHPMAEFCHHVRLLQVLPDKALHLVHQGDPDSFVQFSGHENSSRSRAGWDPVNGGGQAIKVYIRSLPYESIKVRLERLISNEKTSARNYFFLAFFAGAFFLGAGFLAAGFLAAAFALAGAAFFVGTGAGFCFTAGGCFAATGTGFAGSAAGATSAAGTGAAASAAFGLRPRFLGACSPGAPGTVSFFARPRRTGGGGGGGSGGEYGSRNFTISLCDLSLPSSKSRNASSWIFFHSGCSGVMRISAISGNGSFWRTSGHLVRKFLIFCSTADARGVMALKSSASGRLVVRNFHVCEGSARSRAISRLAKSLASSSSRFQRSTKPLLTICFCIAETSLSGSLRVRKCITIGPASGFNPNSCICCFTLNSCVSPEESTLATDMCGTSTLSKPSFSRAFRTSTGLSS